MPGAYLPRHGKDGIVYLAATLAGTLARVYLTTWSIEDPSDPVDVTPFGSPNRVFVMGIPTMGGSLAGFMDMNDDTLFQCRESDEGCLMALYPSSIDPGTYWLGPAWITRVNVNVNTGAACAVDCAWSAAGVWSRHFG